MTSVWPPRQPLDGESGTAFGAADWATAGERSNMAALKAMTWIAVHLGRRIARAVLVPITLYFVLFAPAASRHSRRYLTRALGRPPRWSELAVPIRPATSHSAVVDARARGSHAGRRSGSSSPTDR